MGLAFVDLDGTLLRGASSERAFIGRLLRAGVLGPRQALAAAAFGLRWAPRFGRHVAKKNKAWLAGLSVVEIERRAAAFDFAARMRPAVRSAIERERAAGARIVLLTGAPDFLAEPVAALIGADACCATRCARKDGRFTADPPLQHPFGADKLRLAQALAAERSVRLEDCSAYADSIYDAPLLAAVGRAVAVAPDRALRARAIAAGWPILEDSSVPAAAWRRRAGARA